FERAPPRRGDQGDGPAGRPPTGDRPGPHARHRGPCAAARPHDPRSRHAHRRSLGAALPVGRLAARGHDPPVCPERRRRPRGHLDLLPTAGPGVIQLEAVSKAYGSRILFHDLTWQLDGRERIGLVGPNGAGKTTLCRLLAGLEAPDGGRVVRARETSLGYLPQEAAGDPHGSVLGAALGGVADVWSVGDQRVAA